MARKTSPEPTEATTEPEELDALGEAIAKMATLSAQLKDIPRPTTLAGKLALISGLISRAPKRGTNDYHHYKYVQEADLVDMVRPLLAYYSVWVHQSAYANVEQGIVAHQRIGVGKQAEVESLTILTIAYQFIDGETGEVTPPQLFVGYGDDTGDKGASKASTAASKYFLMRSFLISTGDDPEADRAADDRAAARDATTKVVVGRGPAGQGAAAHGGRQKEASKPQIRALGEAIRAAGVTTSEAAVTALAKLTGKEVYVGEEGADLNAALTAFLNTLTADEVSAAIKAIKEGALARDTPSQEDPEAAAADTPEAPAEAAPEDALEGYA